MSTPVMIGGLKRQGWLVEIACENCRLTRHLYQDPAALQVGGRPAGPDVRPPAPLHMLQLPERPQMDAHLGEARC